jgi:hypothetical protein
MAYINRKDVERYVIVRNYLEEESKRIFEYILKVIPKINPNTTCETLRSWRIERGVFSLLYSYIDITKGEQPIMASFDLPIATVIDQNWKRWLNIQAKQIEQEMKEKEEAEKIVPPTTEDGFGSDYDKNKETLNKENNE